MYQISCFSNCPVILTHHKYTAFCKEKNSISEVILLQCLQPLVIQIVWNPQDSPTVMAAEGGLGDSAFHIAECFAFFPKLWPKYKKIKACTSSSSHRHSPVLLQQTFSQPFGEKLLHPHYPCEQWPLRTERTHKSFSTSYLPTWEWTENTLFFCY